MYMPDGVVTGSHVEVEHLVLRIYEKVASFNNARF